MPTVLEVLTAAAKYHQAGRAEEAATLYRAVIAHDAVNSDARHLLGLLTANGGDPGTGLALIRDAVALVPQFGDALYNLGNTLKKFGHLDEALNVYRRTLILNPAHPLARFNWANALREAGRIDEALSVYDALIAQQPDNDEYHFQRAFALLLDNRLEEGFAAYEHRWGTDGMTRAVRMDLGHPLWQGEDVAGKTVLIYAEQGFGDTLQFVRYVPMLAERGARVILAVQPELESVLATLPGNVRVVSALDTRTPADYQAPLLSLPHIFGTTAHTIPAPASYIDADPALRERWGARLARAGDEPFRVGLVWGGRPTFRNDTHRSPRLDAMLPLMDVPGVRFFGLQMGEPRRDLEGRTMPPCFTDLGSEIGDFADTAGIMANLDLVISSCTAPAHLAGALGCPLWLALSYVPDWRWLLGREDSPWYPSVRLFRQPEWGDWQTVTRRMHAALRERVENR